MVRLDSERAFKGEYIYVIFSGKKSEIRGRGSVLQCNPSKIKTVDSRLKILPQKL